MRPASIPVGLLLAAGRGRRFDATGRVSKLLAAAPCGPRAGQAVAVAAADTLREALPRVLAVVRPADGLQQRQLHAALQAAGCELVINEDADDGIGRSIAVGVAASADAPGWLIALADMPAIRATTVAAVRDAITAGAATAAPVHGGQRGHPVGFGAALRAELMALRGDAGARSVLAAHPPQRVAVDDPGCLLDLDYAADFAPPPA
jgi:molybdenum cofactor cytidylyltransferase